jgi:hypothetical protein
MKKRARDFAKLHQPDPSGFWNLVRTGEKLPEPGQLILFVYDKRGHIEELYTKLVNKNAVLKGESLRGVVDKVYFDPILQEHKISIVHERGFWARNYSPDAIIYWAPIPEAPDTFTEAPDDEDQLHKNYIIDRELRIHEYLEKRKSRNKGVTE